MDHGVMNEEYMLKRDHEEAPQREDYFSESQVTYGMAYKMKGQAQRGVNKEWESFSLLLGPSPGRSDRAEKNRKGVWEKNERNIGKT